MKQRNVYLKEDTHQYFDEEGNQYVSVSKLISFFHKKFDADYWAEKKAKERGITKEEVLAEWDKKREDSCGNGKEIHSMMEDLANGKEVDFEEHEQQLNPMKDLIDRLQLEGRGIFPEKIVYHPAEDIFIAGTIDLLQVLALKHAIVFDWKTNEDELKFVSGYYRKINGFKTDEWISKPEYFLDPIQHLPYSKGMKYVLQLSLYAYLLELWGYKVKSLKLYHLQKGKDTYEVHTLKYLKEEAALMIAYYQEHKEELLAA